MASDEAKVCQNCKQSFVIDASDLAFYERIAVPPPTWCWKCRFQRRMTWRNGWHLYKNNDVRDGKELYSFFPRENNIPVYDRDFWFSDAWDPMTFGRDYDFDRPFFEQFNEFMHTVPEPAHSSLNLVNCRYCMNLADAKNCYLVRAATFTEDSAYLVWDHGSKQSMDGHMTDHCDLCYGCVSSEHCYKAFFCVDCDDCTDVMLCNDCVGCNNCVGCFGLRSKSYCIFNEQYSKEEYFKRVQEMNLGSHAGLKQAQEKAYALWNSKPHKFMHSLKTLNVSGDYIYESKNAIQCYRVRGAENCKYTQNVLEKSAKDCYDLSNFGEGAELCYDTLISGRGVSNIKFCVQVYTNCKNVEYSIFCKNVSNCFGCISVRDKQYCIFNKQYTKEEYIALRAKIIAQMNEMPYTDRAGHEYRYGEFFPPEHSPFPYRVSEAYELFPMTEQEAKEKAFLWYDIVHAEHKVTIAATDLPDAIKDAGDEILQQVIGCEHGGKCDQECTGAFRVIPEELSFLRRMNIPLPRLCPNCRLYERFTFRNAPNFYDRECMKCGQPIYTSYPPEHAEGSSVRAGSPDPRYAEGSVEASRPKIVYCEPCYQNEVV